MQVVAAGGLHIVGTERHESRRIDNQLRGRSGRQGDPGSSRFYLSMEDNLMRIFGDPMRTKRLLQMAGMKEGEVIESGMLTRQIEKAQRKVEAHNFDIRKQLLLFDDVANDQRKVIYQQRTEILGTADLSAAIRGCSRTRSARCSTNQYLPKQRAAGLGPGGPAARRCSATSTLASTPQGWLAAGAGARGAGAARARASRRCARPTRPRWSASARRSCATSRSDVMLRTLDQHWREHLAAMDYLRQGIHLRGYAQKDYRFEYKREAFELFAAMLERVKFDTVVDPGEDRGPHPGGDRARGGGAARAPDAGAAGAARRGAVVARLPEPASGACRTAPGGRRRRRRRGRSARARAGLAPAPAAAEARGPVRARRSARSAATSPVRAARARSTSTATARSRARE